MRASCAAAVLGALLLLVTALPTPASAKACQAEPSAQPAEQLTPMDLLELGAPAVRYLRAFTTQCWLPDNNAPIAMFNNSWAVALVTIWSDLTGPANGLGRLVTAMQLQTEAALMIEGKRHADALSVLELAVLFTLYPVHHDTAALAAWHHSLASNHTMFSTRRLVLARTLTLMTRAHATVGASASNVDSLEAAMVAGRAAGELLTVTDQPPEVAAGSCAASGAAGVPHLDAPEPQAPRIKEIEHLLAEVARNTAKALREAKKAELERLLDKRGLKCRWKCGKRSALLKTLVPALRVPLRLVDVDGEEATSVEVPSDLQKHLLAGWLPEGTSVVERLGSAFAQVVAMLQQPLLSDVGIRCSGREGAQLLHRCREQAARQFGTWSGGPALAHRDIAALLVHVTQVEAALLRLDQVLDGAMTGVRLGDGTTWVKNRGYTWVLGSHMGNKLYPAGQGAPVYYQSRRPAEPHVGSTICLDKTYLLDTVLRLDVEGLRGLQYALDNLQYAQHHSGGAHDFWRLLTLDNPACAGSGCATGKDPLATLVPNAAGAAAPHAPHAPRPSMGAGTFDFRFVSEQQLQADLAAATDPSYRVHDPFVATFVSFCVVSCASLYIYSNRGRLVRALKPSRCRAPAAASAGAPSAAAQRNAATAALRDALAGDNVSRQNVAKLHGAIEAAEATGVEKPLVKKAKAALQALKKRKQHLGNAMGPATAGTGAPQRPPPQQQALPRGSGPGVAQAAAGLHGSLSSGASCSSSGSLSRSVSERAASFLAAAASGWLDGAARQSLAGGEDSIGSSAAPSPVTRRPLRTDSVRSDEGAASTPPKTSHLAPYSSVEPELPTSPGTPVESTPRSSPGDGSAGHLSSTGCSPLPSPCMGPGAAGSDELLPADDAPPSSSRPPSAPLSPRSQTELPLSTPHTTLAPLGITDPSATSEDSSTLSTPTAASAAAAAPLGGAGSHLAAAAAARHRELRPRQQKKLLRLQQKHAAVAAAAAAAGSIAAAAELEAAAPSPASPSQHAPPSPAALVEPAEAATPPAAAASEQPEPEQPRLTEQQLKALAARAESFPAKQPRSAKKKAKAAAAAKEAGSDPAASRDGSQHSGQGGERGPVRRTLSDPFCGPLSPLRYAGRHPDSYAPQDARGWHMTGCPTPAYWQQQQGEMTLNAHAPQFAPSPARHAGPHRLGSPGGYPGGGGHGLPGSHFFGGGLLGGGGGMPRSLSGVPYSPDCALSPFLPSGASSLDPVAPAPPQAATPALQQHQTLLAQLQQIWGEEGGRGGAPAPHKAPPTPGFGGGVLGGGASEQQTQQLAALLFMQQLELTQQASLAGQHGGVDDGALLSPRQLPAASADMLRDVLGSPLSLLPHGGGGGWGAGEAEGGAEAPMRPSMSLTNELAAAQVQALRTPGELPEAGGGSLGFNPTLSPPCGAGRRSLAEAVQAAAARRSLDAAARGSPLSAPAAPGYGRDDADGLHAHCIESFDLEALGFTESGE